MNRTPDRARTAVAAILLGAVATLTACDALKVQNPAAINEDDLIDPNFIAALVNTPVAEFQENYSRLAYTIATFTDEAVTGQTATVWQELDLRMLTPLSGSPGSNVYVSLQRSRVAGDAMSERLKELVPNPSADLGIATTLAYAGYSYALLGEYMCHAPIEVGEGARSSDELLTLAIQRLDEAMHVAITAKAQGSDPDLADRLTYLARVGAARAALQVGDNPLAINYASGVPAEFVWWARYVQDPTFLRNYFAAQTRGTSQTIGVGEAFRFLNDRRVRHSPEPVYGDNQRTLLWTPSQPPSFSGWSPDGSGVQIEYDTDIRMSSGLEAQYILAEAGGLSDTELRAFINERRAVGGQGVYEGTELLAELRDQRRRDFFFDGHRLGDLRRYKRFHNVDHFPSGLHPNHEAWDWGPYGDVECFLPTRSESTGNPGYQG